ncbi:hypothetical protein HNQ80_002236 [Anaerosolibacter carboniphilus]|uniref:SHOCT domain-containing protein n=1 Tax=Anaerosolibacter carboniphilus TaxID=1417629 RepID=A0A841KRU2_9FIRM|nr:hypothetical protein [Anaerosolibacter carboniphilus]MBB6216137.1 hypothetical protein [Anaerosolibacter carboniphilus]
MDDEWVRLEEKLILLCIQVIEILDRLKASGELSEEEYLEHVKEKRAFLNRRSKRDS